jgi:hypothetical protein
MAGRMSAFDDGRRAPADDASLIEQVSLAA